VNNVLATDLDGTLIPLRDSEENRRDLVTLSDEIENTRATLTFVTGRHIESVRDAIERFNLPKPHWVISDVGSSVYRCDNDRFHHATSYVEHLKEIVGDVPVPRLREQLSNWDGLRLQEEEKQQQFKLSFYCERETVRENTQSLKEFLSERDLPYNIISSQDPFKDVGLIDLLPKNISKAYALNWWSEHESLSDDSVVFSGDSGNDLAAMIAGFKTIVVGNAEDDVKREVREHFQKHDDPIRLYISEKHATSAVLSGCYYFQLFEKS